MVEVELDRSDDWDEDQDWQKLAERAVAEAFKVSSHGRLASAPFALSLSINLSTDAEVQTLNAQWRGKDKPTNVLSFPMLEPDELDALVASNPPPPGEGDQGGALVEGHVQDTATSKAQENWPVPLHHALHGPPPRSGEVLLGDLILASGICIAEANEKGIPLTDHITHLIIHGTLHLLGLDHIDDAEAEHMEALEVKALASLGIANPY
jgi:probable rRNA maturation factor